MIKRNKRTAHLGPLVKNLEHCTPWTPPHTQMAIAYAMKRKLKIALLAKGVLKVDETARDSRAEKQIAYNETVNRAAKFATAFGEPLPPGRR
jgi:hypothetical protein